MPSKTFKISWNNKLDNCIEIQDILEGVQDYLNDSWYKDKFKVEELNNEETLLKEDEWKFLNDVAHNQHEVADCDHKPKPIEKLEHQTRWDMDKLVVAKINEIIDRINKEVKCL